MFKVNKIGGIGSLAVRSEETLTNVVNALLRQSCSREGDWLIVKGKEVQGVVRLTPAYARLYEVANGSPVVHQFQYPPCEGA